ncbi:MAG TPA: hypothetical protein VFL29_07050 [Candidatus Dormibacteraeota bacterium]|nr:hypothetical protein [Candidatus Dormibacteraeota bacterium]
MPTSGTIVRSDTGGSWLAGGYAIGQLVTVDGAAVGTVSGVTASTLSLTWLATPFVNLVGAAPAVHVVSVAQAQVTVDGAVVGDLSVNSGSTLSLRNTTGALGSIDATRLHVVSVGYYGNYDNVVIGDMGVVTQDVAGPRDTTRPLPTTPQEIQTTLLARTIRSVEPDNGANDTIYGNGGDSILIGGSGDDSIDGGPGRDLIFGDHVLLDRSSSVTPNANSQCTTQLGCFRSPLFQNLKNTELYLSGSQVTTTNLASEGALQNDTKWQLDPRGHTSWGDYAITLGYVDPAGGQVHNTYYDQVIDSSVFAGNDYIAGGGGNDMIFGELGNDTIQGDGSVDYIAHPYVTGTQGGTASPYGYASTCTNGAHPGTATLIQRVGACRDVSTAGNASNPNNNALFINPSVDRPASDGADYIEGGGGNDVILGNGGQNDILGGNSDYFGRSGTCTAATETTASAAGTCPRPDGSNLIFGGSGTQLDRGGMADTSIAGHDTNSSVIVADNGEIIRIVGSDVSGGVRLDATGFARFNYDNYTDSDATGNPRPLWQQSHIVVRGVTLLDYTPGGPDLASQGGPLVSGDIGGMPVAQVLSAAALAADGIAAGSLQIGSEIHAEAGDAFIYGGPADDVIYGGGQNDTIITGYADNWVSGGRGDSCIIGGGGRCLVSRVSSTFGEPLYGIAATPAANLSQLITTPGNVQQAVINFAGALQYVAEMYPYTWDPASLGGTLGPNPTFATESTCKPNQICLLYNPRFGHNIIYGGWGNGVVHGGPGNSAVSGAEAPVLGFTDNFSLWGSGSPTSPDTLGLVADFVLNKAPIETDFYHPFNPGNPAGWMPPVDPPNGNQGRGFNIGKSLYFDPENPRRQVNLYWDGTNVVNPTPSDSNPLVCGPAGPSCLPFFLTFDPTDPAMPLDNTWAPNNTSCSSGQCLVEPVTGDKALFGDLGNDYIVGGMGRVRVYGGWGYDLIDLRASTFENGGLNDGPVPNLVHNADGTLARDATGHYVLDTSATPNFGTPAWEALTFGGAGQDILFAGTGGDRLIDWVGNHNSFYVPFSQFGMPTVSRTLQPFMPEFLYALSKSDGADPLLQVRFAGYDDRYMGLTSRNGEPFGEMGLVLQHDTAWHEQVGPPFNEMPENLGGVGNDVQKTANVLAFHSPGTCQAKPAANNPCVNGQALALSLPSGAGVNLPSGTNTPGAGAVPFEVRGNPGSSVNWKFSEGANTVSGTGTVGASGSFGGLANLSGFPDGTITVTVTLTTNGVARTLTGTMGKNSVAPPAPTVTLSTYVNIANSTGYTLNITGQAGSIANVVITDGGLPLPNVANGMDMIGSTGTLSLPVDASNLKDGIVSVSVTLTNGAGDSAAWTGTATKDTVAPVLTVSAPYYINMANVSGYQPVFTGETGTTVGYSITDGTTTLTGNKFFNGSNKWQPSMSLTSLQDGAVTLTVTETDVAGNPTVVIKSLFKDATPPAGGFYIAGTTINGVTATNTRALALTLPVTAASGIASYAISTNGGATYGPAQAPWVQPQVTLGADGLYTIAVQVTSKAGNTATFTQQVRLDTTGPAVSYSLTAPTNGTSYDVGKLVTLTFSASDVDNVASTAAVLDGTTAIGNGTAFNTETLAAGTHTIVITAKDGLGNTSTTTVTITVHATVSGLTTAVNDGRAAGKITSSTTQTQLLSYLSSAQSALNLNNHASAKTSLASFVSLDQAQSSITVFPPYDSLLAGWANDLIATL